VVSALAFLASGSSIAQQQFYYKYTPSSAFCGQNATLLASARARNSITILDPSTTVTVYTAQTSAVTTSTGFPSGPRERLRRLAPIPGLAAASFSRSQPQPSRATSFGHRIRQFPLIPRRVRHSTGRQKAQSQRCAR
jgi:hypothetical protein